jgi:hydrogenase nickel incorporation protein HypA/HybF
MHELAVTESILEITLRHAQESKARHVTDLFLVVGSLSSIIDDSVQFYWDFIAKDTLAAGAKLHFRRIPAEFLCLDCTRRFSPTGEDFQCPDCGSSRLKITAGEEFFLESIAIET